MTTMTLFEKLSDAELLREVKRLAAGERHATADLIQALVELDARRLYLGEGHASLFTYCTQALRLSEHAAYGRIEAARAARQHPVILELLRAGSITLTTVTLLKPHLTAENHQALLEAARHRSKREVELLVAGLRPQPDVPASIRKVPVPKALPRADSLRLEAQPLTSSVQAPPLTTPAERPAALSGPLSQPATERDAAETAAARPLSGKPPIVQPLAPDRYRIQFTVSRETHDKLRRVQDLLRHTVPDGDLAIVFDRALTALLSHLERRKLGTTERPRPARQRKDRSRRIPAAVRRAVCPPQPRPAASRGYGETSP